MKLFSRRSAHPDVEALAAPPDPNCPHRSMLPQWASAAEMWQKNPPSSYACRDCHRSFTPAEQRLRQMARAEERFQQGA